MLSYLIICPLLFLAGFVDSIAGGGGLISLPAYTFAGLPIHQAVATNKLSSSMGSTVATWHYYKEGFIDLKLCLPAIAVAFVGSWAGANLNLLMSEKLLKIFILCALPFLAYYVLRKDSLKEEGKEAFDRRKTMLRCMAASFAVGIYDGVYGPGTGTFLTLLFTGYCHMTLSSSVGTTKAINMTTNYAALAVYLLNGQSNILMGLIAGLFNMAGNYLGSHMFSKGGTKITRPIVICVLVLFFIKLIAELVTGA